MICCQWERIICAVEPTASRRSVGPASSPCTMKHTEESVKLAIQLKYGISARHSAEVYSECEVWLTDFKRCHSPWDIWQQVVIWYKTPETDGTPHTKFGLHHKPLS